MNRSPLGLFARWLSRAAAETKGRRHAALALTLAGAVLLAASHGSAGEVRVLLVGPSVSHATVVRVRQELALLGIEVEVVTDGASSDLAALARAHGAAAVARVEDAPPEIRLWVDAAHSAGVAQESRVSESLSGRAEPGLLALRAVELLRGRLVPVVPSQDGGPSATASASPSEVPSSAPVASASASAAPTSSVAVPLPSGHPLHEIPPNPASSARPVRFSGHLGPAFGGSPGGVSPAVSLRLGGGWRVLPPLEIGAVALIPSPPAACPPPRGAWICVCS